MYPFLFGHTLKSEQDFFWILIRPDILLIDGDRM